MPAKTKFEIKEGPATREAFGRALVELGRENKDIVVCDADLAKSTMTVYFQKEFPERFVSCGIAEANMIAIGAGLAYAGKIPFVSSFSVFVMNKGFEQLRVSAAYPTREPEGGGHAQRHFHRRRRPVADEHRGDFARLFAAGLHGDFARR